MDPDSYGRTIENIFHFSFLLKEGNASIGKDDNNNSITSFTNGPPEDNRNKQYVLKFDYEDWEGIKKNRHCDKTYLQPDIQSRPTKETKHITSRNDTQSKSQSNHSNKRKRKDSDDESASSDSSTGRKKKKEKCK